MPPMLEVVGLAKRYGPVAGGHLALQGVDFAVDQGEFVSVVGPSGSGKTTLLLLVAGLMEATSGSVRFRGREITEPPPDLALVFQDYARSLFPWLTARANIALPLKDTGRDKREIARITADALQSVGLSDAADRHPHQLSGGMQQRVAIARALATSPSLLLMDEPFASVDAQTRVELEDLLLRVWQDSGITVVFVTHDIDESVYLSDRVVVLSRPPTTVVAEVGVGLRRPRDQFTTKQEPDYLQARNRILAQVMPNMRHGSATGPAAPD